MYYTERLEYLHGRQGRYVPQPVSVAKSEKETFKLLQVKLVLAKRNTQDKVKSAEKSKASV